MEHKGKGDAIISFNCSQNYLRSPNFKAKRPPLKAGVYHSVLLTYNRNVCAVMAIKISNIILHVAIETPILPSIEKLSIPDRPIGRYISSLPRRYFDRQVAFS